MMILSHASLKVVWYNNINDSKILSERERH